MTDYLGYTAGEYSVDAPATSLHFERWFRNWEAGFEGAPGAPRLDLGALERLAPGTVIKSRSDTLQTAATAPVIAHSLAFLQAGTVRVVFEHRSTGGASGSATVRRIRNGVSVTLATFSNSTSFVARAADCPVEPGDRLEVTFVGGGVNGAEIRNIRFQNDGANLWPGVAAVIEGNIYA